MSRGLLLFLCLLGLWATVEFLVRWQGVVDFPLYDVDEGIGYIPKASQRGTYLGKISWQVNEKNMTSESWAPNQRQDLLLIGDSIVWGGEEYKHEEKLGPSLQVCLPTWSV